SAYLDTMHLGWYQVVILFIVGCMAGLLIEEIWMLITAGLTESRVGLIWGPFSPLYGTGAVFLTVICYQLHKHHANNLVIFLVSVVVGGTLEQLTGWGMQEIFHSESWTYAHLPDAITQWVAWRFLGFWGILGLIWCRVIMPRALYKIGEPTSKRQAIFVTLLTVYLVADISMTVACLGRKAQRDAGIPPSNAFEMWVDTHYDDSFVSTRFQNMTFTPPDSAGKS
ncbi:MAG: putative ABC transporter permease, partial [Atopobium sp.]|nr:putative ABC transporter permease [Atopobium sp.]